MKNFPRLLILIAILFFAKNVFASIEISEVMYDVSGTDTNREWIEVYNTGPDAIDLSKWYFFSNNTKHSLNPNGNSVLNANSYAVITQDFNKFMIDWPGFSGQIFDSSWTGLANEGDSISMKDPGLSPISQVDYTSNMGATGDGNSLQKINGNFIASSPTPGENNQLANDNTTSNTADTTTTNNSATNQDSSTKQSTSSGGGSNATPKKIVPEVPKVITTKIITKNIVTTRVGFSIDAYTLGYNREKLDSGKFAWSFGDGMSQNETLHNKPFDYAYQYPGEYVLTLTYYESLLSTRPAATDSITISVIDPQLFISSVGSSVDPFIEIKNPSEYKMSLSGWVINANTKSFKLPEGMAILPGKSTILPSKVTNFDFFDVQNLSLYSPNGSLVNTYPSQKPQLSKKIISESNYKETGYTSTSKNINKNTEIDLNDLSASANSNQVSNSYLPLLGLLGVIILGIVAVFFAYKKSPQSSGEISSVSASDIKIIE